MRKVREKIMARAMISRSCANFLSDVDVKPGIAQSGGALNKHQHHKIRFRSKYDCWSETDIVLEKRGSLLAGSMEHARFAKRAGAKGWQWLPTRIESLHWRQRVHRWKIRKRRLGPPATSPIPTARRNLQPQATSPGIVPLKIPP